MKSSVITLKEPGPFLRSNFKKNGARVIAVSTLKLFIGGLVVAGIANKFQIGIFNCTLFLGAALIYVCVANFLMIYYGSTVEFYEDGFRIGRRLVPYSNYWKLTIEQRIDGKINYIILNFFPKNKWFSSTTFGFNPDERIFEIVKYVKKKGLLVEGDENDCSSIK